MSGVCGTPASHRREAGVNRVGVRALPQRGAVLAANASRGAGAIALYARYSSELQSPRSREDQLADLRGSLTAGEEPHVYSDEATSGTTWERPGLQALLRDVEAGRVREVRVEHPDRLSRDIGDADRVAKIFRHHDVALVCSNGVTLDGSAGSSLTFGVMAVLSENYLRELGSKTLRGLKGNAREGKATGGRAFGYRTGQEGRIEVVEAEARIVREDASRCTSGVSGTRASRRS